MIDAKALEYPYTNRVKAAFFGTQYYCDFDGMEFESMPAHCSGCEMYEYIMKKAAEMIEEDGDD